MRPHAACSAVAPHLLYILLGADESNVRHAAALRIGQHLGDRIVFRQPVGGEMDFRLRIGFRRRRRNRCPASCVSTGEPFQYTVPSKSTSRSTTVGGIGGGVMFGRGMSSFTAWVWIGMVMMSMTRRTSMHVDQRRGVHFHHHLAFAAPVANIHCHSAIPLSVPDALRSRFVVVRFGAGSRPSGCRPSGSRRRRGRPPRSAHPCRRGYALPAAASMTAFCFETLDQLVQLLGRSAHCSSRCSRPYRPR